MLKLRVFVAIVCILGSVICGLWAAKRTPKQGAQDKCDQTYYTCDAGCNANYTGAGRIIYHRHCDDALDACYVKLGIPAGRRANLPGSGTLPTASPISSPKRKRPQA